MTRHNFLFQRQHTLSAMILWVTMVLALTKSVDSAANDSETDDNNSCALLGQRLMEQQVHPLWLRERCRESFYVDLETRQPKMNLHEYYKENLKVTHVNGTAAPDNTNDECEYEVSFSDGHACVYPGAMLAAELDNQEYFLQALEWKLPAVELWNQSTLQELPRFHHHNLVNGADHEPLDFLETLITTGLALVTNVPTEAGECIRFGTHFSTLHSTEWGDVFNVRSQPDQQGVRQDLAYTSHPIGMHVDNPYRVDNPPAFQLLHALEHCTAADNCQVHNQFVDGFAVAHDLCRKHRPLFDILASTLLRWENNGGDDTSLLFRYAPMIEVAAAPSRAAAADDDDDDHDDGNNEGARANRPCPPIQAINFSAKSGGYAPFMENLGLFYQAKFLFSSWLHSPNYTVSVQLFPGALVFFDNRRILHSRSMIAPTDGARWLQGCYLHRDGILYEYERRRRRGSQAGVDGTGQGSNPKGCEAKFDSSV